MDNTSIKENIRKIRKERKMTQEEMADMLGISITAYRDLERGGTSIMNGNVLRLAELLNTSTEEIVLGYRPIQMPGRKLEEMKAEYSARIESLEKENEYLRKLVKSLEETIATKTQIIEMLQK
ncbi:MAG: helix-turn-helix transcriptional regulator [Bacteroidales bacterium]|nr:helix-turn-helix transcriptional regulator [Bacteroidales bacterium]MBR5862023.1 helix-turn-helix transcriptional regulator [Bacteroidales bacterium]